MDHPSDIRPTKLFDVYHVAFERTEPGMLRIYVLEVDPDTKAKLVNNIIELDPATHYFVRDALDLMERYIGSIVSMRAQWAAAASRCASDEGRIRSVLKAFRKDGVEIGETRELYVAAEGEYAFRM